MPVNRRPLRSSGWSSTIARPSASTVGTWVAGVVENRNVGNEKGVLVDDLQARVSEAIHQTFENAEIAIDLDGNRAGIQVVSDVFEGMSRVKRQQAVYAAITAFIQSGELHAVTIVARAASEA